MFSFTKYNANSMNKWDRFLSVNITTFTMDGKLGNTSNRNSNKVSISSCENTPIILV